MKRLRVVLVEPRFAANIGSTARVCANFGISEFHGVSSIERHWFWDDARKIAVAAAADILDSFQVHESVESATRDCELAIGFTRRSGDERAPTIALRDLASLIQGSSVRRVALVFGNEETGLTDEELMSCSHFCTIPTADALPSMNLSHAVALVTGRLYDDLSSAGEPDQPQATPRKRDQELAPLRELHGLFGHFREFLIDAGLTQGGNPDRLLRRVERILHRASLSSREARLLRGILSKAQYRMRKC